MDVVTIKIDRLPPSINHYWQHTSKGGCFLSADAKSWTAVVCWIVEQSRIEGKIPKDTLKGKLSCDVTFNQKNAQRRDVDNGLKATFDALTKARLWIDDAQIWSCRILKTISGVDQTIVNVWQFQE